MHSHFSSPVHDPLLYSRDFISSVRLLRTATTVLAAAPHSVQATTVPHAVSLVFAGCCRPDRTWEHDRQGRPILGRFFVAAGHVTLFLCRWLPHYLPWPSSRLGAPCFWQPLFMQTSRFLHRVLGLTEQEWIP